MTHTHKVPHERHIIAETIETMKLRSVEPYYNELFPEYDCFMFFNSKGGAEFSSPTIRAVVDDVQAHGGKVRIVIETVD